MESLITNGGNVMSQRLIESGAYFHEIEGALGRLAEDQFSALDGLSEEEAERALGKSNIIECRAGDRVLKKGGVARNMFVVLEGNLEVRDDGTLIRVLSPGDIFGEMALFDDSPRAASAKAHTEAICLAVSKNEFDRRLDNTDPIIKSMMQCMMGRVRTISDDAKRMRKKLGSLGGVE